MQKTADTEVLLETKRLNIERRALRELGLFVYPLNYGQKREVGNFLI